MKNTPVGGNFDAAVPYLNKAFDKTTIRGSVDYSKIGSAISDIAHRDDFTGYVTLGHDQSVLYTHNKLITNTSIALRDFLYKDIKGDTGAIPQGHHISIISGTPTKEPPYSDWSELEGCRVRVGIEKKGLWKHLPKQLTAASPKVDRTVIRSDPAMAFPVMNIGHIYEGGGAALMYYYKGGMSTPFPVNALIIQNAVNVDVCFGGCILGRVVGNTVYQEYDPFIPNDILIIKHSSNVTLNDKYIHADGKVQHTISGADYRHTSNALIQKLTGLNSITAGHVSSPAVEHALISITFDACTGLLGVVGDSITGGTQDMTGSVRLSSWYLYRKASCSATTPQGVAMTYPCDVASTDYVSCAFGSSKPTITGLKNIIMGMNTVLFTHSGAMSIAGAKNADACLPMLSDGLCSWEPAQMTKREVLGYGYLNLIKHDPAAVVYAPEIIHDLMIESKDSFTIAKYALVSPFQAYSGSFPYWQTYWKSFDFTKPPPPNLAHMLNSLIKDIFPYATISYEPYFTIDDASLQLISVMPNPANWAMELAYMNTSVEPPFQSVAELKAYYRTLTIGTTAGAPPLVVGALMSDTQTWGTRYNCTFTMHVYATVPRTLLGTPEKFLISTETGYGKFSNGFGHWQDLAGVAYPATAGEVDVDLDYGECFVLPTSLVSPNAQVTSDYVKRQTGYGETADYWRYRVALSGNVCYVLPVGDNPITWTYQSRPRLSGAALTAEINAVLDAVDTEALNIHDNCIGMFSNMKRLAFGRILKGKATGVSCLPDTFYDYDTTTLKYAKVGSGAELGAKRWRAGSYPVKK